MSATSNKDNRRSENRPPRRNILLIRHVPQHSFPLFPRGRRRLSSRRCVYRTIRRHLKRVAVCTVYCTAATSLAARSFVMPASTANSSSLPRRDQRLVTRGPRSSHALNCIREGIYPQPKRHPSVFMKYWSGCESANLRLYLSSRKSVISFCCDWYASS